MSDRVKRIYASSLRDTQARQTRRAIVDAGARLFVRDGFGKTTIDAVAALAGVSRKTVFTSVGGKVDILRLAIEWAVAGDDEPVPLSQRAEISRLREERDPARLVEGWVDMGMPITVRVSGLFQALVTAAGSDDQAHALLHEFRAQRLQGARALCRALAATDGLRPGLSVERAADIAFLHSDPHLYSTLVTDRGWSKRAFGEWVKETLRTQLLVQYAPTREIGGTE